MENINQVLLSLEGKDVIIEHREGGVMIQCPPKKGNSTRYEVYRVTPVMVEINAITSGYQITTIYIPIDKILYISVT